MNNNHTFDLDDFNENGDKCLETFGKIISADLKNYWKFMFTIDVVTDKGYLIEADFGGDAEMIYRFSPWEPDWCDVYWLKSVRKVDDTEK